MPFRKPHLLITLLAFAWFVSVALREHHALERAKQNLSHLAALLESSPLPAKDLPIQLRMLAKAFGYHRLSIHSSDGALRSEATLPLSGSRVERSLLSLGILRKQVLEAESGEGGARLRAAWIDRGLYGHLAWLGIFALLGSWVWLLIRRIARERRDAVGRLDAEHDERLRTEEKLGQRFSFERLLAEISSRLGALEAQELESGIKDALGELGRYAKADRSFVFLFLQDGRVMDYSYGWKASDVKDGSMGSFRNLPCEAFDWWVKAIHARRILHFPDIQDMPAEASSEKYLFSLNHVRSIMALPIVAGNRTLGFLGFSRMRESRGWDEDTRSLLRLAGEMLGGAIERQRQHASLSSILKRERLLKSLSGSFLSLSDEGGGLSAGVEAALAELAAHAHVDRACVFQVHGDGERLSATQEWNAPGVKPMLPGSKDISLSGLPVLKAKMSKGEVWKVSDLSVLGDDASAELTEWRRRLVRSFLACPLLYQGLSLGLLLLERIGGERDWSEDDLESARQAGPLLASLFARQRSESALKRSEARNRSLVEAVPDMMLRVDLRGKLLDLRQPKGRSQEIRFVPGQALDSLEKQGLAPFNPAGLVEKIMDALKSGKTRSFDWQAASPKGGRWMEARVLVMGAEALVLVRDVQEKKNQELEHEKLLANLLAIFNAGKQSIILISREMKVEAFNQNAAAASRMMHGRRIYAGAAFLDFVPRSQTESFLESFERCLAGEEIKHKREALTHSGQGIRFHIEYLPVFSEDGRVRSVCCSYESLDELQKAELALHESEERYALAARGSNDGLWDWNLVTGKMFFSERWSGMLGLELSQAPKDLEQWIALIHPDERDLFRSRMEAHIKGQTSHFEVEYRIMHRGTGDYTWVLCRGLAVRDKSSASTRVAGSQTDIHMRKRAEDRQELDALSDPLTGLPNRALVLDRVGRCLARMRRRESYRFAVLLIDSDNFKMVNDSLGHAQGDELLIAVARRLERLLRPGDTVGRLGGDEYAILLEDLGGSRDALAIAERVHQELRSAFDIRGKEVFLSASIGIAMSQADYNNPEEVLRDAETAMYQAKAKGPSQHLLFDQAMHAQAVSRLEMETELRKAVASKAFELYYQPVIDLKSGAIYGFEALLRWEHAVKGMIAPLEFIPLAEETRQILPLGRFVLEEACRQLALWLKKGMPDLTMNVNLSMEQLKDEAFADQVAQVLKKTGVPARCLQLEITESVLMDNPAAAASAFARLKALGLRLAIDDFGTGYSSLSYLHRFPVDTLKIDHSFISRINGLPENEAITAAVVSMGRNLGLTVVAEGVENEIQKQRLKEMNCHLGQGFLFDRPLKAGDAGKRLQ